MVKRGRSSSYAARKRRKTSRKWRSFGRRRLWRRGSRRNMAYKKTLSKPVADRLFTKMKYAEITSIQTPIPGVLTMAKRYQSSLQDPDYDLEGHQPMWRDQYAGMYSSYRVRGIKYNIMVNNQNFAEAGYIGVRHLNNPAVADPNITQWMERNDTITKMVGGFAGNGQMTRIKGYMSVAKTRGVSPRIVATDDRFGSEMNGNPALMAYLGIYVQGGAANQVFNLNCKLTYYVELFDPVTPGQS